MRIRTISDDEKRVPRKIKKHLFGKRGCRTEKQQIRYDYEVRMIRKGIFFRMRHVAFKEKPRKRGAPITKKQFEALVTAALSPVD